MLLGELITVARARAAGHRRRRSTTSSSAWSSWRCWSAGYPSFETDHGIVDFAAIARACGIEATAVEDPRKLREPCARARPPGPRPRGRRTDPNALSIPPHITASQVRGFALAATRTVLDGGVGRMIELARSNLRSIPRP